MLLAQEQLERLFPFHFVINKELKFTGAGPSFTKLFGNIYGHAFSSCLKVERPVLHAQGLPDISRTCEQLIILSSTVDINIKMRGQFEFIADTGSLLFAGTPWFDTIEKVTHNHLTINDFAYHDPLIDLLHLLKNQEIVNEDLKGLLNTINDQKKQLKMAAKEVESMALFPMQDPNPIVRVSKKGLILMSNPAAQQLHSLEFQNCHYSHIDFWHLIAQRLDEHKETWTFEAKFQDETFSFICKYFPNEGYFNVYGRNVTEQKYKEQQLKLLSQIAEDNINAVIITDIHGAVTWVNKSFVKMTGYTLPEVLGKKPGHLLQGPETDNDTIVYLRNQISQGSPFSTEILNYAKDGAKYWLRIQGQPIFNEDHELSGFFALEEDITHERELQQQIQASESRFKTALEKIGDNVWEYDFTSGRSTFAKSINKFLGYADDRPIDNKESWWEIVYPPDLAKLNDNHLKYQQGLIDHHDVEYRIVREDGTLNWVLDRGVVIEKDINGLPLKSIGTHTNITSVKQTELELEQRVKQFKALTESIPGVIYEYEFREDGTEGLRYISPALKTIFGISPDEFEDYLSFIHPDDHARIAQKNAHSKATLQPFYDESTLIIPGKGLKSQAVHSSFAYVSQTGAKVFTGFIMDITERKQAENLLKANEEKYRSIIANMNLGLLEVDTGGIITFANQAFSAMSGYPINELIGREAIPLFLKGDNATKVADKFNTRRQGIADAYQVEAIDRSGNDRWWLISGAPRYNDKGELVGSIGIHLDITDQKEQENELIEARIQAERLAQTKEIFLANMSHEIRTPMNAIIGMSNQLAKTSLSTKQEFYLDTILSASENLLVIINDILDLSKIDAGKLSLEHIGFELQAVAKQVMQVLALKAEEKGLILQISAYDNRIAPVLLGDPYRITQILINLINNSIKFTEKGSVSLSIELLEDNIRSQIIKMNVHDTGIGMDSSFVEHLFDKFSQECESVTRKYGGTGLGMSICKELVELMNGSIFAQSEKGIGTQISFTIEFEKGKPDDLPQKEKIQIRSNFLTGRKVLITDDNALNRLVASIILQNHGAIVFEAVNGEQAIETISQNQFDVVLMDIQMPGLNGFEAARALRAAGEHVPVIALTAGAIKGERKKCIEAGMNDYISKPFKEEEFLRVIDSCLKQVSTTCDPSTPTEPLYDLSELITISRGNKLFVQKMVDLFCDQTPLMFNELKAAFKIGNLARMGEIAHKIKPSIDNLNILSLKSTIRKIEGFGKEGHCDASLPDILEDAERRIQLVITAMRTKFSKTSKHNENSTDSI